MAYLTRYNFNRVFSDRYSRNDYEYPETHWLDRIKYLYGKSELQRLYAYEAFVKDPVFFCQQHGINFKDSYTYVYENPPAYHTDCNCALLHKDYTGKGAIIPEEIRRKGHDTVAEYRKFYKQNLFIHDTNKKDFFLMVNERFHTNITDEKIDTADRPNSGMSENINNMTLDQLRIVIGNKIDSLIKYRDSSSIRQAVCNRLATRSYMVIHGKDEVSSMNITGYANDLVYETLQEIHKQKQSIIDDIKIYIYRKNDPNQGNGLNKPFLEGLGFKPCPYCNSNLIAKL